MAARPPRQDHGPRGRQLDARAGKSASRCTECSTNARPPWSSSTNTPSGVTMSKCTLSDVDGVGKHGGARAMIDDPNLVWST